MAKLCLMTILVILLVQLFSFNRAYLSPDDAAIAHTYTPAWRYRCVPDEGCERTTHPQPGFETSTRNHSAMVFPSMDACRTVCGRFGGLWPRPVTAAIGIQTVKIHPNYLRSARNRSHRVSYEQLDRLWEFLNSHRDLAVGFNKSAQARDYSKRMWLTISETLNSLGEGATKDWKGWSNYWVDYKAKLKRRVAALRTSQNRTGGGPADVNPLSDVEKKFLSLLGEGFGSGLPNTQVDPFPILTPPTTHVGPDDGQPQPPQPQNDQESFSYDGPQTVNIEQPPLSQQGAPSIQEEESSAQQAPAQSQRLANIQSRRRSRRPYSMSQQLAREALVEISRDRLLAEQENSRSLRVIAETLQGQQQLLQNMLGTLNRIAAVIDRSIGPRRPETRDESIPDS